MTTEDPTLETPKVYIAARYGRREEAMACAGDLAQDVMVLDS